MASKSDSGKSKDANDNETPTKKMKLTDENGDLSLDILPQGFRTSPVFNDKQKLTDLPEFLEKYGSQITKLNYTKDVGEKNTKLILEHCPNIGEVSFEFTKYPDAVSEAISQRLVEFLTALAPDLTRLKIVNKLLCRHQTSCMTVYKNCRNKIRCIETDELKPEELSVLCGDNDKSDPALSLEELVYGDHYFLPLRKRKKQRNFRTPESLALKPASLTALLRLTNLRRITLPVVTSCQSPVVTPWALLDYASIRLLPHNEGKVAASPFTNNIGKALANVREVKLTNSDRGLLVLVSILENCVKLEKLNLTDYRVINKYIKGLERLSGITNKFKQLDNRILPKSQNMGVLLCLIENTPTLETINVAGIKDEEDLKKICSVGIKSFAKVKNSVEMNVTVDYEASKKLPDNVPNNLKLTIFSNASKLRKNLKKRKNASRRN